MKSYKFIITLYDSGNEYPDRASAEKDAWETAIQIGQENLMDVADVQVDEEE